LLANEEPELFPESSASEILTYLTITGESFRELWKKIVDIYSRREPLLHAVDLTRMASMILGVDKFIGKERRYYRQIVNGPFDADKLDYLPRDGYFTGLAILVDIERLLHTVTVVQDPDHDYKDLGVLVSGSSVLEQIIFARTQLYTSIYHHHKVRAAHKLLEALFQKMFELKYRPAGYDLSDPVSYMMLDDYDLLHGGHPAEIDTLVRRIKNRQLPKRALVISYASLTSRQSRENVDELSAEELLDIERQVESELHLSRGDVMIDVPDLPRLYGTSQALVSIAPKKTLHLQDIYPAGAWAKAHAGYRKVAYVFTTSKDRREVGRAAKAAFAKLAYPIKLNENSLVLAKVDS